MKKSQQGFIGIVLAVVIAVTIGGGVYYSYKQKESSKIEVNNETTADIQENNPQTTENQKPIVTKKPLALSFEAKARAAALAGECQKYGTIGASLRVEEQNEYALFSINKGSESIGSCAVDMYQRTTVQAIIHVKCEEGQTNCGVGGLLPTPRKVYENIPTAPAPSTFQ